MQMKEKYIYFINEFIFRNNKMYGEKDPFDWLVYVK